MFDPTKPYNDLPLLPPREEVESANILKKTISASRALSELKGAVTNLPNPLLSVDTINIQEAQASSEIENIVTTQDELFTAATMELKITNPATKEVLHYKDAMWHGVKVIQDRHMITTNLLIDLVQVIKQNSAGIRDLPGTKLKNPTTTEIIYTPPDGKERLLYLLNNLEKFMNVGSDLDPLVKMAITHYQFEAIHPFFDGNGRTGRILLLLYLIKEKLLGLPCLYLSRYILKTKSEYYKGLRNVTENQKWEPWILYMLDMIEQTAISGLERIQKIEKQMKETSHEIQQKMPKAYSKDLIEALYRLPYTKRKALANAKIGTLKTVGNYLKELEIHGILSSKQVGKEKLYLNLRLIELLKE